MPNADPSRDCQKEIFLLAIYKKKISISEATIRNEGYEIIEENIFQSSKFIICHEDVGSKRENWQFSTQAGQNKIRTKDDGGLL
jgi:hypothetical protein